MHGRRPRSGLSADGIPDPHGPVDVSALKPLFSHGHMLA
jgi:hypothetical protein